MLLILLDAVSILQYLHDIMLTLLKSNLAYWLIGKNVYPWLVGSGSWRLLAVTGWNRLQRRCCTKLLWLLADCLVACIFKFVWIYSLSSSQVLIKLANVQRKQEMEKICLQSKSSASMPLPTCFKVQLLLWRKKVKNVSHFSVSLQCESCWTVFVDKFITFI